MSDPGERKIPLRKASPLWRRFLAGLGMALALAFSAYILIDLSKLGGGFHSLWFLAILPAFLSALVCYVGDPLRSRGMGFYWGVPALLTGLVCVGSVFFLREGVICLIMLSPIWLVSGWVGAFIVRALRKRKTDPARFYSSLLLLPLLAGVIENRLVFPHENFTVTRQIVIDANAGEVWPYAVSNAHIAPSEGHWTFSHDITQLARPRATAMQGEGVGAIRTAYWGSHISFDEVITAWQPGRRLAWDFRFDNTSLQDYTDKHISPDGPVLKIASGEYILQPLGPDRTRLTLRTHYTARTHLNLYAALWGEVFLGDVHDNVLAIIKARAEKASRPRGR